MKIQCRCGKTYNPSPRLAWKKVRCKNCSAVIQIPAAEVDPKASHEDAVLSKYNTVGPTNFDDRAAERQRESSEEERVPNIVKHVLIGFGCIVCSFVLFFILQAFETNMIAPALVWIFNIVKAKFWMPPILFLASFYEFYLAYWYYTKQSGESE
jgi:hypothetical protein